MNKNDHTVFIIEDEPEVRSALQCLFESIHLNVEAFENANDFLENYDSKKSGCLILDVRLPGMSGLELLEHLKDQKIHLPVIIISGYGDVQMAIRAMKAGAKEFIEKPFNEQHLLELVQKYMEQVQHNLSYDIINEQVKRLSERERQILDLIIEGKLNKQIAHELSISISTVEAHRSNIMHKMEVKQLAQLIKSYLMYQMNNESIK